MFRVFKTLFEMLYDRGYLVRDQDLDLTFERFRSERCLLQDDGVETLVQLKPRRDLWLLHRKPSAERDGIFVFFPEEPKMGVRSIKGFHDKMVLEKVARAIVVTQQPPTSFAKQAMQALTRQGLRFTCPPAIHTERRERCPHSKAGC